MAQNVGIVEMARQVWDAVARGDPEAFRALCAPDVVWQRRGDNPLATTARGADAVLDLLAGLGEVVDEAKMEMRDVFEAESRAVLKYTAHFQYGSRVLVGDYLIEMTFDEDGLMVEAQTIAVDAACNDAFWREAAESNGTRR